MKHLTYTLKNVGQTSVILDEIRTDFVNVMRKFTKNVQRNLWRAKILKKSFERLKKTFGVQIQMYKFADAN